MQHQDEREMATIGRERFFVQVFTTKHYQGKIERSHGGEAMQDVN
jgi:hypothetical protein